MILITGSTGYVGRALLAKLQTLNEDVRGITRDPDVETSSSLVYIPSINETTDWSIALEGVHTVVHCAAVVHQMTSNDESKANYQRINTNGSLTLAQACIDAGVRRLVNVSTIKVCGDATNPGQPFTPDCPILPTDDYGKSKADAEKGLMRLSRESGLQLVIVRPPLVYGPEAKGNLELLIKLVRSRVPLPLASIKNQRSLVGLENLVDFLILSATHPKAPGQIFNISDGKSMSTADVLRIIGKKMNCKVTLISVPVPLLRLGARLIGRSGYIDRLTSNLEVDSSSCTEILGWQAPRSVEESIASLVSTD